VGHRLAVSNLETLCIVDAKGVRRINGNVNANVRVLRHTWSPSGSRLLPALDGFPLVEVGDELVSGTAFQNCPNQVLQAAFSPDETQVAVAIIGHSHIHIQRHEVSSGNMIEHRSLTLTPNVMAARPEHGRYAFAAGPWVEIRGEPWNPVRAKFQVPGTVHSLAFSADGHRLLVATDRDLQVWGLEPLGY
jgi:hypothetical protein